MCDSIIKTFSNSGESREIIEKKGGGGVAENIKNSCSSLVLSFVRGLTSPQTHLHKQDSQEKFQMIVGLFMSIKSLFT